MIKVDFQWANVIRNIILHLQTRFQSIFHTISIGIHEMMYQESLLILFIDQIYCDQFAFDHLQLEQIKFKFNLNCRMNKILDLKLKIKIKNYKN